MPQCLHRTLKDHLLDKGPPSSSGGPEMEGRWGQGQIDGEGIGSKRWGDRIRDMEDIGSTR